MHVFIWGDPHSFPPPLSLSKTMEMNPMKAQQGLQGVTKGKGAMPIKKTLTLILQVILLLSILSLIIFYYCCTNTSLHQSLQQLINSRSMFLFCNAILLFLARDSGVLGSFAAPVDDLYDALVVRRAKRRTVGIIANVDIEAVGLEKVEKGGECLELVVVIGGKDQLGVDELNKRCEEFIERVKRERKLEDLQLVIG